MLPPRTDTVSSTFAIRVTGDSGRSPYGERDARIEPPWLSLERIGPTPRDEISCEAPPGSGASLAG